MNITFTHNGFHGYNEITVKATGAREAVKPDAWGDSMETFIVIPVSARTAKRISKITCGFSDCTCGESPVRSVWGGPYRAGEPGEIWIEKGEAEVRGFYPQG